MRRRFQLATAALATAITFSQMACAKPNTAQSSKTDKQSISLAGGVAIETASIAVSNVVGVATNIFLTKQEVTEALWHEIMGGDTPDAERAALPKAGVSYLDIQEFLRKLNERREVAVPGFAFRLPTAMELVMSIEAGESELDVSGNGGSDTGAPETLLIGGWFAENAEAKRHPVGSAKADENGVSDLLGNVWEMTSTEVSGDDGFVVCLGGSFKQKASRCRSGSEYWYGKTDREDDVGFRLVVIDRAAYLALREQEDRENALAEIKKWMFVAETDLKHAKGMGKIIYNRQLDALNLLQGELEGKKIAHGIEGGTREAAQKGDRLVVWKSENNNTEITYDGKSFAFHSTNESEDDFRDAKTESVATIGDAQQTKVFFKKIGDLWNEMIKGASFEMEASFPEIESAEWTYQNASVGKAYGRKRFVELGVRSEGAGRYGKAEWLVLSTTMFKAKEGDWSWMSEIRISENDVFAIKEKHLVVDDLVAKYARMTGGVLNASGEAAATEVKSNGDISSLVLKLGKDMIMVPNRPFCICKYEVTQALWKALMGGNPSYFKGDDLPVDSVSWDDCQTFIQRLNSLPEVKSANIAYRLPTDEEWEYACRAGKKENDKDFSEYAWIRDAHDWDADTSTHSVGTKKANAYGLYDMIGNVAEWTSDEVVGKYFRNSRGGCFDDSSVGYDTAKILPYCYKGPDVGFRLVYDSIQNKNIDGQTAVISEKDELGFEDINLSRKANEEQAEIRRKEAAEPDELVGKASSEKTNSQSDYPNELAELLAKGMEKNERRAATERAEAERRAAAKHAKVAAIEKLATRYSLELEERDDHNRLSGNFATRAERLRATAEAYALSPGIELDLSDDESFRASAEDALFLLTEGALKVMVATNRYLHIAGTSDSPFTLTKTLESLNSGLPKLRGFDVANVTIVSPP